MANGTIEDRARKQNPELKEMFDEVASRKVDGHAAGAIGEIPNPVGSTNSHGVGVTIPEEFKSPAVIERNRAKEKEDKK